MSTPYPEFSHNQLEAMKEAFLGELTPKVDWTPQQVGRACGILEVLRWAASYTVGQPGVQAVNINTGEVVNV